MEEDSIPVAIAGASGYSGQELIRLLLGHPRAKMVCATSRQYDGQPVTSAFPGFRKFPAVKDLTFSAGSAAAILESGADTVFLALPHGLATEFARPLLAAGRRVLDISADFRVKDPGVYEAFYGQPHPAPELLKDAVYGLPERYREKIRGAQLIACPGCYPTSILLPLLPLVENKLIDPSSITVTSLSGVTGAGRKVEAAYIFPECNENARAYGIPKHRHLSEIEQELSIAAQEPVTISFTPVLAPLNRGILTQIYARPAERTDPRELESCLIDFYETEPFVRVIWRDELPATANVQMTNFCDIAVRTDPRTGRVIIISAEDNLTKGASGQAIQCFNLMHGLEETAGLF